MKSKNYPTPNEADLEASIHAAIEKAFPYVQIEIEHQVGFKFHVGRTEVNIDAERDWIQQGRADIVLSHQGRPLAVLELKRKDSSLKDTDRLQGLSYARMLDPIAPLVIVTNGRATKIYSTHNGQEWVAGDDIDDQLIRLFDNACLLAEKDIRNAVQTLMGRRGDVWPAIVKQSTADTVESLTGELEDIHQPFARDFLVSRQVTHAVIEALERSCLVILEGEPLIGKSSVLRQVIDIASDSTRYSVLYMEDGGGGYFQCLADALSKALGWNLAAEDGRAWLRSLRSVQDSKLIILIDQYISASESSKRDLEDLVGIARDGGFSVVVAVDNALVDDLTSSHNSRRPSLLGRLSERVTVRALSDEEFEYAVLAARSLGVTMMNGSFRSDDYRRPWILRSVVCSAKKKRTDTKSHVVEAPPLPGIDFISYVREAYDTAALRHHFYELAKATLEDYLGAGRSESMEVEAAKVFLLRKEAFCNLSHESKQFLSSCGAIRMTFHEEQPVIRICFYEMLVSELSSVILSGLEQRLKSDVKSAIKWLMGVAEALPLGEIIAARAVVMLVRDDNDPTPLWRELLAQAPILGTSSPHTKFAIKIIELPLCGEGPLSKPEQFAPAYYNDNILPWITLSHVLTAHPAAHKDIGLFPQLFILMEVAKTEVVLRRPGNSPASYELFSIEMKDGTFIVAWNFGIIEPVTYAIFNTFREYPRFGAAWMENLKGMDSVHLLARTYTVLIELIRLGGLQGQWASYIASSLVEPLLINHPNFPSEKISFKIIDTVD